MVLEMLQLGRFARVGKMLGILFTDILPANLSSVIPNAFFWCYRARWTGAIRSVLLESTSGNRKKTARLFSHGEGVAGVDVRRSAVLFIPGEHSHPLTMLHLADIAQAEGRAVFSLHLSYDDARPETHRLLLRQAIDCIAGMVGVTDLLLVGHSRGALEAANEAYVEKNPKISGVIALAGRFKVMKPSARPCRLSLEESVYAVWEKLHDRRRSLPIPLYQIAAANDWCMDPAASIIRPDYCHLSVRAGHLGVISHPSTQAQFRAWIHTR